MNSNLEEQHYVNTSQQSKHNQTTSLKILHWNCNGLKDKLQELLHFMEKNNILTATLQETYGEEQFHHTELRHYQTR